MPILHTVLTFVSNIFSIYSIVKAINYLKKVKATHDNRTLGFAYSFHNSASFRPAATYLLSLLAPARSA